MTEAQNFIQEMIYVDFEIGEAQAFPAPLKFKTSK